MNRAWARLEFCRDDRNANAEILAVVAALITGGSGFVGLNVAEHLLARGEQVVSFDRAPPPPEATQFFSTLDGVFEARIGDVRSPADVGEVLRGGAVDKVIHAAAITPDARSESGRVLDIVSVNVGGAVTVLKAALDAGVRRFVYVSSAAVYAGNSPTCALDEEDGPLALGDLYGISKLAAERALLRVAELHRADLVCVRLGAVFGPWERRSGARDTMSPIWQATRLARRSEQAILPRAGRKDWLYSRDAAAALAALLDHEALPSTVYNVGPGVEWTLVRWCEKLARDYRGFHFRIDPAAANVDFYGDADRPPLSVDRLAGDIGFYPRFEPDRAYTDYMAWLDSAAGTAAL